MCVGGVSHACRMFPILILLLALGHVCELPAYADAVSRAPEVEQAPATAHGDADEHLVPCDAVDVVLSTSAIPANPVLEMSKVLPTLVQEPIRMVVRTLEAPTKLSPRPPLFLLHASLLI
jgi:hypothetical protein